MQFKDFQLEGIDWLTKKRYALLADDMGLGKTIQVIGASNSLMLLKILIIGPAVARGNWQNEFDKWSIAIRLKYCEKLADTPTSQMVCSYNYAVKNKNKLAKIEWDLIVIDESHFLKSPTANRTKAIYGGKGLIHSTKRMWLLSGTPAPNGYASEMWTFLYTFGVTKLKYNAFVDKYCQTYDTGYGIKVCGTKEEMLPEVREMLNKVMLMRFKSDVLDLPALEIKNVTVEPCAVDIEQHKGLAHYTLPTDRIRELSEQIEKERLVMDAFLDTHQIRQESVRDIDKLEGMASSITALRRHTGLRKLEAAKERIIKILTNKSFKANKIVVFAVHRDVLLWLRENLKQYRPVLVYGGTSAKNRERHVKKFQEDDRCKVFLGNIAAAGTAITLTASHRMLFVEQCFVPGNNAQAIMRVYRMGQTHNVLVENLVLRDSFDGRIAAALSRKVNTILKIFHS